MSKRSRRARAKFKATQQAIDRGEINRSEVAKAKTETRVLNAVTESPSVLAQTARYQYMLPELRRIGIIAGALFIIIIILSFIIS